MPFEKPTPQEKTLKVLIYGLPKTGKSHFVHTACQVGPVMWMDTEHGSDYYDAEAGHGFTVAYDKSPGVALSAIQHANNLVAKNGNQERPIVAVDSVSSTWFMQQEVAEELTKKWSKGKDQGRASFRAWGPAKKPLKKLYDAIMTSRCHIILTARAKVLYAVVDGEPTEKGIGPDMEKGMAYTADIVLETGHDTKGYFVIVRGSRSPQLELGTKIYNPGFADLQAAMTLAGEAPKEVRDTQKEQVKEIVTAEAKAASAERAKRMFQAAKKEVGFYANVAGMLKAIRLEKGDDKWIWPAADDDPAWLEAFELAKAHARKNSPEEVDPDSDLWKGEL